MKLVSFRPPGRKNTHAGAILGDELVDLHDSDAAGSDAVDTDLAAVLAACAADPSDLRRAVDGEELPSFDPADVELEAPVASDARIIALGGAFASHLRERGNDLSTVPSQWIVPPTSVVGPDDPIVLAERVSENVRPAVELGVVIGRGGRNITETEALDHVAGYTIVNDVTARTDWPGPMAYKLMDTFSPCGPHVVPADRVDDPLDLAMEIRHAGRTICRGSTAGLRFTLSFIISYLSTILTLRPGDVISTGDPGDVSGELVPGSPVKLEIDSVGTLSNPVMLEGDA